VIGDGPGLVFVGGVRVNEFPDCKPATSAELKIGSYPDRVAC
jgi:hypothetical protein